jgi:hypothetical protein
VAGGIMWHNRLKELVETSQAATRSVLQSMQCCQV